MSANYSDLNVCFVALHALPAIKPSADRPVGGTETRAWTFARGLAANGSNHVSFVVRGEPGIADFVQQRVRVLPRYDRLYSLHESVGHCLEKQPDFPWLRVKRVSGHLLWQVPLLAVSRQFGGIRRDPLRPEPFFERIDADVFCTFGVQANSARVIASAHAVGKPAILMIGSDGDLDQRYVAGSTFISPYGDIGHVCDFVLQNADAIVAQTPHQQRMLAERFGRESTLVANPFDLAGWERRTSAVLPGELRAGLDRYALWIGRAELLHKRPQVLLDVARRCPEVDFLMLLNRKDPAVERQIQDSRPANVHIVQAVPFDLMPAVFSRAAVFVSTSALEGFPNVFLQAAASRVPIASLDVGDEFIASAGCGQFCKGDVDRLASAVRGYWIDEQESQSRGGANEGGRAYVAQHHDLTRQVRLLEDVLRRRAPS